MPPSEPPFDVVTLGEGLITIAPPGHAGFLDTDELEKSVSGAELNTAVGLARAGLRVTWVSRVGEDDLGRQLVRTLAHEGVDTSRVQVVPGRQTGLILKQRPNPERVETRYYRAGSAATVLSAGDTPKAEIRSARWLHLTGITIAIGAGPADLVRAAVRWAAEHDVTVSFDPNFRPQLWRPAAAKAAYLAVLPDVTDLLCNEAEAALLVGPADPDTALTRIHALGPHNVVIKLGARGAVASIDGAYHRAAAMEVDQVVDTVGAGDAFNAGWIAARLANQPIEEALDHACATAARVVQSPRDF